MLVIKIIVMGIRLILVQKASLNSESSSLTAGEKQKPRVALSETPRNAQGLLHSRKLTWKPKKGPIKTTVLLKGDYMGFHVSLEECRRDP